MSISTNDLWGTQIDGVAVDIPAHQLDLSIHRVDSGEETMHVLSFGWVTEVRIELMGIKDDPWNYAEWSEIYLRREDDSSLVTEILLWFGGSRLFVRSERASLDGRDLGDDPALTK